MRISLLILGHPATSQAACSALCYARAAIGRGHSIFRVFFYYEGVCTANALAVSGRDDLSVQDEWRELSTQYGIELQVCIAAASRRGILDPGEAQRHAKPAASLAAGSELAGLGQLVEADLKSERLITFAP